MPGILLRDIPETIHDRLKMRALANRRSVAKEAISILEQVLDDRAGPPPLDEIDRMRIRGRNLLTQKLLDEARHDGRP